MGMDCYINIMYTFGLEEADRVIQFSFEIDFVANRFGL